MPRTNIASIESRKIDKNSVNGLSGVYNSLAYKVHEIEKHFHGLERWYGSDGDDTASTANGLTPFVLTAGVVGVYGTEVQMFGANDVSSSDFVVTPLYFDLHRILALDASQANDVYMIQIWAGTTTFAESTLVSETPFYIDSNTSRSAPIDSMMNRISVANKLWGRVRSSHEAATASIILGLHVYTN